MYIDCESVYLSSSAVKQTSEKLGKITYPVPLRFSFLTSFQPSCHHRLKKRNLSLKTNKFRSIWPDGKQRNHCVYDSLKVLWIRVLEKIFGSRAIAAILTNILALEWRLLKKWKFHLATCLLAEMAKMATLVAKPFKMLYPPPSAVNIAS